MIDSKEDDNMLTLAFKECNVCDFKGKVPTRTIHCPECKTKKSMVNRPEELKNTKSAICACGCGETVYVPKRFVSGHNGRLNSKPGTYRRNGRPYTMINCTQCKKEFERRADSVDRRGLRNFCSRDCHNSFIKMDREENPEKYANSKLKLSPQEITGKRLLGYQKMMKGENRVCKVCSKEFYANRSHGKKYCSKTCYNKDLVNKPVPKAFIGSTNNSGKKNGRYKDGKRIGTNINKRKLREKVMERDGGKCCLICGSLGPDLHLHRIIYGSQCGKYELDNCVQLCTTDHGIVHNKKPFWQKVLLKYVADKKEASPNAEVDFKNYMKNAIPIFEVEGNRFELGYGQFDD